MRADEMALKWGEDAEVYGLVLHPLTMKDYGAYLNFGKALTVRLSGLGAKYAVRCYADALYMLMRDKGDLRWMMFKMLWGLAMGIPKDDVFKCILDLPGENKLNGVRVRYGEMLAALLPSQINEIREIIAVQNGLELPDESDNAEIMDAEEDAKSGKANGLDLNVFDEIASVAAVSHLRLDDMKDMRILEYTLLRSAQNRRMNYILCSIAEGNGAKFKGGNPCPTWLYNKTDELHGLVRIDKWEKDMNGVIKGGMPQGMGEMMGIMK